MSWRKLTIVLVLTLACVTCIFYAVDTLVESLEPREQKRVFETHALFPAEEEEEPEVIVEETSPPLRPLAIIGRVLSADLSPHGKGAVHLGDEVSEVAGDGSFRFPEAARPRFLPFVFVDDGGRRIEFPATLVGERRSPATGQEDGGAGDSGQESIREKPEHLDWTLILAPGPVERGSRFWIAAQEVFVEEWGRGARIRVRGTSDLPDGSHISAHVRFDDFRVGYAPRDSVIEDSTWSSSIRVSDASPLYSGKHELVFIYSEVLQPPGVIDSLPADALDEIRARGTEIVGIREVLVGDRDRARAEDLEEQEYYRSTLETAKELYGNMISRVRDVTDIGKGWDPALLETHGRLHATWFRESYVNPQGEFEEEKWRDFLDRRWRPPLERLLRQHRSRQNRKYQEAENRTEGSLDSLLRLSKLYSSLFVYATFNLPAHSNDYYVDEREKGDISMLESRLKENFKELERFSNLVPEETSREAPGSER